ncbi:alpha/beta hydrolase [Cytobacillus spongiae]|uniref:alpha/beta hydrolase n=1 Tax=Cytobacillus spongiae TaxID=2901381 RepID=UPI001F4900AD|nr:alpha/beta hydrolase [Cytobacillus spongiae]UII56609.1 alpha/beta hydrolase [Cytobacillus spongiae]
MKKTTLPIFFIHGDQDELVPTEMVHRLYEAAGGQKEIWIVKGAGHTEGYTVAEEEYQKRLHAFLKENLKVWSKLPLLKKGKKSFWRIIK